MRAVVLAIVFVGIAGIVQMRPSPSHMMVGVITAIEPGRWMAIAGEQIDPRGVRIALSSRTRVDGDPRDLRRNARVQILYAYTAGGPVARRVIVLPNEPQR